MGGAVALKPIHRVRQRNLEKVVKTRFKGNASECARVVKKSHTFMWQLVNGYRSIGEDAARHIEKMLDLGERELDEAKPGRTTKPLTVTDGRGHHDHYPVREVIDLDDPCAKTRTSPPVPSPLPNLGSAKTFCAVIKHEEVKELEPGDRIFFDRADLELTPPGLYVVRPDGAKTWMVLQVVKSKGLVFTSNRSKTREYSIKEMKVIGRVIAIVRAIPKLV